MPSPQQLTAIIAAIALVGVVMAGFFLQSSGVTTNDLLSFSISAKVAKIASPSFIAFLLFLPFVAGLISALPGILKQKEALIAVIAGCLVGSLIVGILFMELQKFLVPFLFFILGSVVAVPLVYMKKAELKSMVGLRLAYGSTQRQMMIVAIGLAVWAAWTILPQQAMFQQNFESSLLNMSVPVGDNSSSLSGMLTGTVVDLSIKSQQQVVQQIMAIPSYQAIQASSTPEDQAFVVDMATLQQTISSPEYKELLEQQVASQIEQNPLSGPDLIAKLKTQLPILVQIEKWLWLIFAFGLASIYLLVSGIILQPVGIVWGVVFQNTVGKLQTKEETPYTQPPRPPEPSQQPVRTAQLPPNPVLEGLRQEFPPGEI